MRFLFIVQGEGRGHMTQAIALGQLLEKKGHTLTAVCIGKSERRQIPDFVYQKINAPIYTFESPNFVTDKSSKSIRLTATISYNLLKWKSFKKSLKELDTIIQESEPDVILNFYDMLAGIYSLLYRPSCSFWTIGHQYLVDHPTFIFPKKSFLKRLIFKFNNKITSIGADLNMALSFQPLPQSGNKIQVLPPLLREEIRSLETRKEDFILAYTVNPGYGEEILEFAAAHPDIKVEAFWDKKGAAPTYQPLPNLIFHQINDKLFLEKMAACRGLISTAGFESICEAMYLGKKVMMIPVKGQFEQSCNALDAVQAGAGITHGSFDISVFDQYLQSLTEADTFPNLWTDQFEKIFFEMIGEKIIEQEEIYTNYSFPLS
jgi:uncharacterized protein (TIGR00661 family)